MWVNATALRKRFVAKKKKIYKLNQEAVKYCFKEGYKIYPVTSDNVSYRVEVSKAHQIATIKDIYYQKDINQAIADTYEMIYTKRKAE